MCVVSPVPDIVLASDTQCGHQCYLTLFRDYSELRVAARRFIRDQQHYFAHNAAHNPAHKPIPAQMLDHNPAHIYVQEQTLTRLLLEVTQERRYIGRQREVTSNLCKA